MTERCFDGTSTQQGEATYDNYRKFTVQTRESLAGGRHETPDRARSLRESSEVDRAK